jgi:hypothetical protein
MGLIRPNGNILDREICDIIEGFIEFIGRSFVDRVVNAEESHGDMRGYYMTPMFKAYEEWRKAGAPMKEIPFSVVELANIAKSVQVYKHYVVNPAIRRHIINRLQLPDHVSGLIFEFAMGVNLVWLNRKVEWLPNIKAVSECDFRVTTRSGSIVLVECTCKRLQTGTILNLETLSTNIVGVVRQKARQMAKVESRSPKLLSIFVMDSLNIEPYEVRSLFRKRVTSLLQEEELPVLTAVEISFYREPIFVGNRMPSYREVSYPAIRIANPNAVLRFPQDFQSRFPADH